MTIRRILIFVPLILVFFLLQSYFWVPTYEQQTRGNPNRLKEYIEASTGDASILNPILSADSASSDINNKVFEGLIDRDEELLFRPRLAGSWDIYEEAFFYVNEGATIPGLNRADADDVVELLLEARAGERLITPELRASLENIRDITVIPAREFFVTRPEGKTKEGEKKKDLRIRVRAPARVKMVLREVDQDLFQNLTSILGPGYFRTFPAENYLSIEQTGADTLPSSDAKDILPATEHNPIIVFHLRPNVKFHDGHTFDAHDVKFTYEAIMNPKNISPRLSDYEPVKRVDAVGLLEYC